jgi:hypothetical protein
VRDGAAACDGPATYAEVRKAMSSGKVLLLVLVEVVMRRVGLLGNITSMWCTCGLPHPPDCGRKCLCAALAAV